jgi:ABC-type amino acid transport substrate-binding protein
MQTHQGADIMAFRQLNPVGAALLASIAIFAAGLCQPASAGTLDDIKQTRKVRIGVREASYPFSFRDTDGKYGGYTVELCEDVAQALRGKLGKDITVSYVQVASQDRLQAVIDKRIDMECGSTTNTRERQDQVGFAYTTFVTGTKLLTRSSAQFNGLNELGGKRLAVTAKTSNEKLLQDMIKRFNYDVQLVPTRSNDEGFAMVESGAVDAYASDDVLLHSLRSKAKQPADFKVVGPYLSIEPYSIMLRKGDTEFASFVNAQLRLKFESGQALKSYDKWFVTARLHVPLAYLTKDAYMHPSQTVAMP